MLLTICGHGRVEADGGGGADGEADRGDGRAGWFGNVGWVVMMICVGGDAAISRRETHADRYTAQNLEIRL